MRRLVGCSTGVSQRYLVNHLIFCQHCYSLWYALSLIGGIGTLWSEAIMIGVLAYLFLALRRLYRQSWWLTAMKSVALFGWLDALEMLLGLAALKMLSGLVPDRSRIS